MKIRKGFVTNSSSSSYICDICGQNASGYDVDLSSWEMWQCSNGHTFCERHASVAPLNDVEAFVLALLERRVEYSKTRTVTSYWSQDKLDRWLKEAEEELARFKSGETIIEDFDDDIQDARYECPPVFCPVCNFEGFKDEDLLIYILKSKNIDKESIQKEIKEKFKTYDDFVKYKRGN